MTYRRDSDILSDSYVTIFETRVVDPENTKLSQKPNGTSWMVSHCTTNSKREKYAAQLFKYTPGEKLGKFSRIGAKNHCPQHGCTTELLRCFKFHLAFENSVCKDYITEQAYRPLNYGSVPIVLGGADYKSFMPQHSYINVEDVESPKHLAIYLNRMSENSTEHESYFNWRFRKELWTLAGKPVTGIPDHDHSYWCELCRSLSLPPDQRPRRIYEDVYEWWFQPGQCRKIKSNANKK